MPTDPRGPVRLTGHLVFGILIIVLGVLFTLDNLEILDAGRYLRYWPAGLIAVGVVKLIEARRSGSSMLGGVLVGLVGAWLLLDNLAYVETSVLDLWPLILVAAGAVVVWHGLQGRPRQRPDHAGDHASEIHAMAILSGVTRGSSSPAFRGGELTAFMGGCEIDLRQAAIHGEAVLDVFAMWGGLDIRVPDTWTVISRVTPILGGFEDHTRPPDGGDTHRLILRGVVVMGGIDVKN